MVCLEAFPVAGRILQRRLRHLLVVMNSVHRRGFRTAGELSTGGGYQDILGEYARKG